MTTPRDPSTTAEGQPTAPPTAPPYADQGSPYGQPLTTAPRNGAGTAALVLGILALLGSFTVFGGIVLGIVAIVLGVIGRRRAARGEATNRGSATAGLVLGIIGAVLALALVAVGVTFLNSDTGKKLQDCLNSAGSDQAAQASCQQQFRDDVTK